MWCPPRCPSAGQAFPDHALTGANVAVAEVRGLARSLGVLVLERREAVLGKCRHTGGLRRPQLELVAPGCVARVDSLLGATGALAERWKAILRLHVPRHLEPAQRLD